MDRKQLAKSLKGGEAFHPLEDYLQKIPFEKLGIRPEVLPYSVYELFHHIVFAQKDILDFILSDDYKAPNWPKDYWPGNHAPENKAEWEKLVSGYFEDRDKLAELVLDEENDLDKPVKQSTQENQTLLREVLLVIEHTSYHTGQIVVVLRLLKLL